MKRYVGVRWMMVVMVSALLVTVSCARKEILSDASGLSTGETVQAGGYGNGSSEGSDLRTDSSLISEDLIDESEGSVAAGNADLDAETASRNASLHAESRFVSEDIYFSYDRFHIDAEAQAILELKAEWLKKNPLVNVTIEGHCDDRGTTEYNLSLGERRAESVRQFLVDLGISVSRMTTISYGEEKPADPGRDEAARARNRRAHFVVN